MALSKGVNSYVEQSEANTYFSDRMDVAAWSTADPAQKDQALITATQILDDMSWVGLAISEDQKLAFPRSGSYFDPRIGSTVYLSDTIVPVRIERACMELAYHLLNNDGLLDDTGGVAQLKIGSITLDQIKAPSRVPSLVRNIIKPLLVNAGASSWWRAN